MGVVAHVISYSGAASTREGRQRWGPAPQLLVERRSASVLAKVISYIATISACEKAGGGSLRRR